jgi:hypothetical protein
MHFYIFAADAFGTVNATDRPPIDALFREGQTRREAGTQSHGSEEVA